MLCNCTEVWFSWAQISLRFLCYGFNIGAAFFVLQENGSSEEHVLYVWDHFVSRAAAKNVFIVAHSYGGLSFVELVSVSVFHLSFLPPTDKKTHSALQSGQSLWKICIFQLSHTYAHTYSMNIQSSACSGHLRGTGSRVIVCETWWNN